MAVQRNGKRVGSMTLGELRQERDLLGVWIRDVNAPKRARMLKISKEIERRSAKTGSTVIEDK
jgi:hypothetical protein